MNKRPRKQKCAIAGIEDIDVNTLERLTPLAVNMPDEVERMILKGLIPNLSPAEKLSLEKEGLVVFMEGREGKQGCTFEFTQAHAEIWAMNEQYYPSLNWKRERGNTIVAFFALPESKREEGNVLEMVMILDVSQSGQVYPPSISWRWNFPA